MQCVFFILKDNFSVAETVTLFLYTKSFAGVRINRERMSLSVKRGVYGRRSQHTGYAGRYRTVTGQPGSLKRSTPKKLLPSY